MSENILKLVLSDPNYIPTDALAQRAVSSICLLFPSASEIGIQQTDQIRFIDQGANFERIICPECGSAIDGTWWREAMDSAFSNDFMNLNIVVPCCSSTTSLNELRYEWPDGFARFSIEIINPGKDLANEEQLSIESILSTRLKKIWAHY